MRWLRGRRGSGAGRPSARSAARPGTGSPPAAPGAPTAARARVGRWRRTPVPRSRSPPSPRSGPGGRSRVRARPGGRSRRAPCSGSPRAGPPTRGQAAGGGPARPGPVRSRSPVGPRCAPRRAGPPPVQRQPWRRRPGGLWWPPPLRHPIQRTRPHRGPPRARPSISQSHLDLDGTATRQRGARWPGSMTPPAPAEVSQLSAHRSPAPPCRGTAIRPVLLGGDASERRASQSTVHNAEAWLSIKIAVVPPSPWLGRSFSPHLR